MKNLLIILSILFSFNVLSQDSDPLDTVGNDPAPVATPAPMDNNSGRGVDLDGDRSSILAGALSTDNQEEVAKLVFRLSQAITDEFFISDSMSMTIYMLRIMSEVGEYELVYQDIVNLVKSIEKILEEEMDAQVWDAIHQIRKIRFGTIKGEYAVTIFAKDEKKGVVVAMDEEEQRAAGDTTIIQRIVVEDEAVIKFEYADTPKKLKKVQKMITGRSRVLGIFNVDDLNQIHTGLVDRIEEHLLKDDIITPLLVEYDGIYADAMTSTIFKHMKFTAKQGVLVPGVKDENNFVYPSFVATANAKLLKLRTSIDQ